MVLWKKESTGNSACYVDLMSEYEQSNFQYEFLKSLHGLINNKSADKSTQLRKCGNEQFKAKNWYKAMDFYNKSLCHAPNGSENLSLAYANRSLCFYQMQKYERCLADIEMAKAANYPERLVHKLDERRAACLQQMNEKTTKPEEEVEFRCEFLFNILPAPEPMHYKILYNFRTNRR